MIINMKLCDGSDLIGQAEEIQKEGPQKIVNPLMITADLEYGQIMSLYGAFAKDSTVHIDPDKVIYVEEASDIAREKYLTIIAEPNESFHTSDQQYLI